MSDERMSDSWMGPEWGECPKGGDPECSGCTVMLDEGLWRDCPKLDDEASVSGEDR